METSSSNNSTRVIIRIIRCVFIMNQEREREREEREGGRDREKREREKGGVKAEGERGK